MRKSSNQVARTDIKMVGSDSLIDSPAELSNVCSIVNSMASAPSSVSLTSGQPIEKIRRVTSSVTIIMDGGRPAVPGPS